jgi:predicted AlkP superfamily phosphohydrolase/phosphomutase
LSLGEQISAWVGKYMFDVPNFRSDEKGRILRDIYHLCNQSFTLALNLLKRDQPDLLMFVEMGVDRIHHALWRHTDPSHPLHIPNSPYANAIHDYYCHVDRCIGQLLSHCDDDTAVLVVSDHGAQPLMGGFCLNEWLRETGYLTLKEQPTTPLPLEKAHVDWSQTKAWGTGGYYGRIFLNVEGREPEGIIPVSEYHKEREELIAKLESLSDPWGNSLGVKAYIPQQIYQRVRGIPPDLIVYFQDLAWRSQGTVGGNSLYRWENDTGADDANHARSGIMIFYDPKHPQGGQSLDSAEIYDILPTILAHYGISAPTGLRGKILKI